RIAGIIAIMSGAVVKLELVWALADVFNGLMALPNLIALLLLSPVIFKMTRDALSGPNPAHADFDKRA
ncbi:MAG: alanine:cation symporter family protein, partial [Gammaproteobacteria bacterium]